LAVSGCLGTTDPGQNECNTARILNLSVPITSLISQTDCVLNGLNRTDVYALTLIASGDIQIDMASNDFDPFLSLYSADEEYDPDVLLEENNNDGGELNARIVRTLPAGRYIILAQSLDLTGVYTVSAIPAPTG
jgi:hypothetical protein